MTITASTQGNDQVIHYTGPFSSEGPMTGRIVVSPLEIFAGNCDCYLREYSHRYYGPSESLARAHQRLGERAYNLQFNNCEHFVTWCIQGVHHSEQVDQAWSTVLLAITLAQTPLPPIRTTVPTLATLFAPHIQTLPTWLLPWRRR